MNCSFSGIVSMKPTALARSMSRPSRWRASTGVSATSPARVAVGAVRQVGRPPSRGCSRPSASVQNSGESVRQTRQHHHVGRRLQPGEDVLLAGEHHVARRAGRCGASVRTGRPWSRASTRTPSQMPRQMPQFVQASLVHGRGCRPRRRRYGPDRAGQHAALAGGAACAHAVVAHAGHLGGGGPAARAGAAPRAAGSLRQRSPAARLWPRASLRAIPPLRPPGRLRRRRSRARQPPNTSAHGRIDAGEHVLAGQKLDALEQRRRDHVAAHGHAQGLEQRLRLHLERLAQRAAGLLQRLGLPGHVLRRPAPPRQAASASSARAPSFGEHLRHALLVQKHVRPPEQEAQLVRDLVEARQALGHQRVEPGVPLRAPLDVGRGQRRGHPLPARRRRRCEHGRA